MCDKVCQWLVAGRWFTSVFFTNKTDRHDITEILLKVAFNTISHKSVLERNRNLPESPFGAWWQSMRKDSVAPVLWSCWIRLPLFIWYFLLLFMALCVCHECRLTLSIVPSFSVTSGDATLETLVDMSPLSRCAHLGNVFLWAWRLWCNASLALELVKLGGIGGEDAFNL